MISTHTHKSYPAEDLIRRGANLSLIQSYPDGRKLYRVEWAPKDGVGSIGYSAWAEKEDEPHLPKEA